MDWISVKDKLPKLNETVLCYTKVVGHICAREGDLISSTYYQMTNCDTRRFCCEDTYKKVTHWMPLPDPPEEENRLLKAQVEKAKCPGSETKKCSCNTYGQKAICTKCGGVIVGWSWACVPGPTDADFGRTF